MYLKLQVKVPESWLRASFWQTITIHCEVVITDYDGYDVIIKNMTFPGWYAFLIKSDCQEKLHDLICQMAMDKYSQKKFDEVDEYGCYD